MKRERKDAHISAGIKANAGSQTLVTYQVGALPILNSVLKRMKLEEFLREYVEEELVERELRRAMAREKIESLPLYPEGRPCGAPTTRRVVDLFENVQRHELQGVPGGTQRFLTSLSAVQKDVVELLGLPAETYGA